MEEEKIEETQTTEPSQEINPVEEELEKIEKAERTRLERLQYNKDRIDRELAEEAAKNGVSIEDENRPLTVREFKAMRAQDAQETAKELAEREVMDDNERKLTLHHLENTIKPSGDAATDLRNARLIVNAVKNRQIAEEMARTTTARSHSTGAGAPPKQETATVELSADEKKFAAFAGLTPEEVAAAR